MALSLCSVMTIFAGKTAYLFSYFINDSKDGLHLAYSYDGLNWMPLNGGQSYLIPSVGKDKLMRDPSICQARTELSTWSGLPVGLIGLSAMLLLVI